MRFAVLVSKVVPRQCSPASQGGVKASLHPFVHSRHWVHLKYPMEGT